MMPGYPFFSPFNFGRNYYNSQYSKRPFSNNMPPNTYLHNDNFKNDRIGNKQCNSFQREPQNSKNMKDSNSSCSKSYEAEKENKYYEQFFEFFGIKLYFDDLLILGLLFLLYMEDSHDDFLYIILLMLLFG